MTSVIIYDGATGIGGNKIFVEENGKGIFLDFGKNFGKYSQFYEEFLKSRDSRGIHDLLYLDILPRLDIYRPDLIPDDLSLSKFSLDVAAVLITHAHMDHCMIGPLRNDIPIVASPETIAIMKGMQDSGIPSIEMETAYISPRKPPGDCCPDGTGCGRRLAAAGNSYRGRDFCCTERPSEALVSFLSRRPGQDGNRAKKKLEPGTCCSFDDVALPFEISAHPVDHSIFGATAYILSGEITIAYTGDFRLHGKNAHATRDFVRSAGDATVLILEGTNAGEDARTTEESVREACRESVESSTGLVVADFSARNFERLESFQEIARSTERELVVTAKDIYMLHHLQEISGSCTTDGLRIYCEITDRSRRKWEQEVVLENYKDRYVCHEEIRRDPGRYILCFSFFDMKHLLDIKPEGGTYIYSGCEAFNEEMEIDFRRLWNWLKRFNMDACGFYVDENDTPHFDGRYHASGHASGEDITRTIEQIDPDYIVPVHTEKRDWFAENFENVVMVEEGRPYRFG